MLKVYLDRIHLVPELWSQHNTHHLLILTFTRRDGHLLDSMTHTEARSLEQAERNMRGATPLV